jgi:type 1 glutamine amidotransferase
MASMKDKTNRILVLTGDAWHSANAPRAGLENLDKFGFQFVWKTQLDQQASAQLSEYAVVILAKANHVSETDERPWMTEETEQQLLSYVRDGHALYVMHSGLSGYEQLASFRQLVGGVFVDHPDFCPVTLVLQDNHPLTVGVESITDIDEHYFVTVDAPDAELFATTTSEHGSQAAGWTRKEGTGRVCVLATTHSQNIWVHASYQQLLANTLTWCVGS